MASKKPSKAKATDKVQAANIRPLSPVEKRMLDKGYASSRMVAQKLDCDWSTVNKHADDYRTVRLGKHRWFEIESVNEVHCDAAELLELDDWSFPDGLTG